MLMIGHHVACATWYQQLKQIQRWVVNPLLNVNLLWNVMEETIKVLNNDFAALVTNNWSSYMTNVYLYDSVWLEEKIKRNKSILSGFLFSCKNRKCAVFNN